MSKVAGRCAGCGAITGLGGIGTTAGMWTCIDYPECKPTADGGTRTDGNHREMPAPEEVCWSLVGIDGHPQGFYATEEKVITHRTERIAELEADLEWFKAAKPALYRRAR